jgi:hypothetical protein
LVLSLGGSAAFIVALIFESGVEKILNKFVILSHVSEILIVDVALAMQFFEFDFVQIKDIMIKNIIFLEDKSALFDFVFDLSFWLCEYVEHPLSLVDTRHSNI